MAKAPSCSLDETIRALEMLQRKQRIVNIQEVDDALFWLRALHAHRMALEQGSSPPAPVVLPLPPGVYVADVKVDRGYSASDSLDGSVTSRIGQTWHSTFRLKIVGEPTPEAMAWLEQAGVKLR